MLTRVAPRLARPVASRLTSVRYNVSTPPPPPPPGTPGGAPGGAPRPEVPKVKTDSGLPNSVIALGVLGGAGLLWWYMGTPAEVEAARQYAKDEAKIVQREHEASKVTSME